MTAYQRLILQMRDIHVIYNELTALKGVDFDLYQGEIHALIGEHRAGKSSLVKILTGAVTPTRGSVIVNEQFIDSFSPKTAIEHKISVVYQNIHVIPALSVLENVFIHQIPIKSAHYLSALNKAKSIFSQLDVDIELNKTVSELHQEEQIMVEIARALSIDPKLIIFDEISSKLTPTTLEHLYQIIFDLKQKGTGIIYISDNIDEIFEFADRVTILKDGLRRGTEKLKDLDKIRLMNLTYSHVLNREELKQENRELYFFKKYNESIIKNLPIGVVILTPEQKLYLLNYAAIQILELEDVTIANQGVDFLFKREMIAEFDELMEKVQAEEEYMWDEVNYGKEKILKVTTFPFKDEYEHVQGTILLLEDISKDRFFEDYLVRTEKIASVAELAAGVAHEINNPLGIISNYINVLQKNHLEDQPAILKKMEKELNRIVEIVGSLLSFAKLKQAAFVPINLVEVINEVVLLLNHKITEKKVNFVWENTLTTVPIYGHENRLKQVFINLIINSIEAVLEGGLVKVFLSVNEIEGYVKVTISDDGYGIPEDIMKKIFDPFFSTKANKKNSGLGLSICQHIIDSHQGLISVGNQDRTTMTVTLPLIES